MSDCTHSRVSIDLVSRQVAMAKFGTDFSHEGYFPYICLDCGHKGLAKENATDGATHEQAEIGGTTCFAVKTGETQ